MAPQNRSSRASSGESTWGQVLVFMTIAGGMLYLFLEQAVWFERILIGFVAVIGTVLLGLLVLLVMTPAMEVKGEMMRFPKAPGGEVKLAMNEIETAFVEPSPSGGWRVSVRLNQGGSRSVTDHKRRRMADSFCRNINRRLAGRQPPPPSSRAEPSG